MSGILLCLCFYHREVDVNFLGTTAPLSLPGKDGASCTQEDLHIYTKDFLSWMALDTLQYHLLTLNFIFFVLFNSSVLYINIYL